MDETALDKIYDKINAIAINIATMIAESKARETVFESYQKTKEDHETRLRLQELKTANTADHEIRLKTLEKIAINTDGSNAANASWKATLLKILEWIVPALITVIAMRAA